MIKNKLLLISVLIFATLTLGVSGCANKPPANSPSAKFCRAPAIPAYSREFWTGLLSEDKQVQDCCPHSYKALEDWYVTRGQIEKCDKK